MTKRGHQLTIWENGVATSDVQIAGSLSHFDADTRVMEEGLVTGLFLKAASLFGVCVPSEAVKQHTLNKQARNSHPMPLVSEGVHNNLAQGDC